MTTTIITLELTEHQQYLLRQFVAKHEPNDTGSASQRLAYKLDEALRNAETARAFLTRKCKLYTDLTVNQET